MPVPEPTTQTDHERPIDLTDVPDRPQPVHLPEHHPDDEGMPGEQTPAPTRGGRP